MSSHPILQIGSESSRFYQTRGKDVNSINTPLYSQARGISPQTWPVSNNFPQSPMGFPLRPNQSIPGMGQGMSMGASVPAPTVDSYTPSNTSASSSSSSSFSFSANFFDFSDDGGGDWGGDCGSSDSGSCDLSSASFSNFDSSSFDTGSTTDCSAACVDYGAPPMDIGGSFDAIG